MLTEIFLPESCVELDSPDCRHPPPGLQGGWQGREGGTVGAAEQPPGDSGQLVVAGGWQGREAETAGAGREPRVAERTAAGSGSGSTEGAERLI